MRRLLLSDLWPTAAKLSKSASRVRAAIAYVSSAENLHLRSGDTLIADASENAIKTAQTSATVLRQFFRRGVAVYHWLSASRERVRESRFQIVPDCYLSSRYALASSSRIATIKSCIVGPLATIRCGIQLPSGPYSPSGIMPTSG